MEMFKSNLNENVLSKHEQATDEEVHTQTGNQDAMALMPIILQNLEKCAMAMESDVKIAKSLESSYYKSNPCLFTVEEGFLSLAASETAHGIFFLCLLKIDVDNKTYHIARYFEDGAFKGYYHSEAEQRIKEEFEISELLPYLVFTHVDVEQEQLRNLEVFAKKRTTEKGKRKKYYSYKRLLFENANCIHTNLKNILTSMENCAGLQCLAMVALCMQKQKSWDGASAGIDSERYFVCHPESGTNSWSSSMTLYRSNQPISNQCANQYDFFNDALPTHLTLKEQFQVISSLPNHHKWKWDTHCTKLRFRQKLSSVCRYPPASPRNRIINACCWRDDSHSIVTSVVLNIFGSKVPVNYCKRRNKNNIKVKEFVGVFVKESDTEPPCKKILSDSNELLNISKSISNPENNKEKDLKDHNLHENDKSVKEDVRNKNSGKVESLVELKPVNQSNNSLNATEEISETIIVTKDIGDIDVAIGDLKYINDKHPTHETEQVSASRKDNVEEKPSFSKNDSHFNSDIESNISANPTYSCSNTLPEYDLGLQENKNSEKHDKKQSKEY